MYEASNFPSYYAEELIKGLVLILLSKFLEFTSETTWFYAFLCGKFLLLTQSVYSLSVIQIFYFSLINVYLSRNMFIFSVF